MTDEELRNLVSESGRMVAAENSRAIAEQRLEAEKRWQAAEEQRQEMREATERQRLEAEKRWQAAEEQRQEMREATEKRHEKLWEEILASRQETDRLITHLDRGLTNLRREVGGIANRLGLNTEAMFLPSLEGILREDFGMTTVAPRVKRTQDDEEIEIDVLAHAETDAVYIVEVKTHLREDALRQILDNLRRFSSFFPEHRGKKVFGILGEPHA